MSKVENVLHIVINTKHRQMTIPMECREALYQYITAVVREKDSKLITAGGISNHVHMLIDLSANTKLADLMKAIKQGSSVWMKGDPRFPYFAGWGKEYFACAVSHDAIPRIKQYIVNQERHHMSTTFEDEYYRSVKALGLEWDDRILT